ncbi:MAG: hypothetical protein KC502_21030 [Myxococcales bacterium]|nr:hypothetical protein [Myxococcales bacterium]
MAQGKHDSQKLTASEMSQMAAFEARTGDGSSGVDGVVLPDELALELDDFVALTQQISALDDIPAVHPSVRGHILSAAASQAPQESKVAWLLALLRPAPMAMMGIAAAVLVAVAVRPDQVATKGPAASAETPMVAMERKPTAVAPPEMRAAADDSARKRAQTAPAKDKPAEDIPGANKATRRQKLFAAQPASLGPAAEASQPSGTAEHKPSAAEIPAAPRDRRARAGQKKKSQPRRALEAKALSKLAAAKPTAKPTPRAPKREKTTVLAKNDADDQLLRNSAGYNKDRLGAANRLVRDNKGENANYALDSAAKKDAASDEIDSLLQQNKERPTRQRQAVSAEVAVAKPAKKLAYKAPTPKPSTRAPTATRPAAAARSSYAYPKAKAAPQREAESVPQRRAPAAGAPAARPAPAKPARVSVARLKQQVSAAKTSAAKRKALLKLKAVATQNGDKATVAWATKQLASLASQSKVAAKPAPEPAGSKTSEKSSK